MRDVVERLRGRMRRAERLADGEALLRGRERRGVVALCLIQRRQRVHAVGNAPDDR